MTKEADLSPSSTCGPTVLVVAGGTEEAAVLARKLRDLGFQCIASVYDEGQLTRHLSGCDISLIILDLEALYEPQDILRGIRNFTRLPLVVLGSSDRSEDEVVWFLKNGADDYIGGRDEPTVLAAQLRAVLRHTSRSQRD